MLPDCIDSIVTALLIFPLLDECLNATASLMVTPLKRTVRSAKVSPALLRCDWLIDPPTNTKLMYKHRWLFTQSSKYCIQCRTDALNVRQVPWMSDRCPECRTGALNVGQMPWMSDRCPECQTGALNVRQVPWMSDRCPGWCLLGWVDCCPRLS